MFSNAAVVGMGLILFYYLTIIIIFNNSSVGMGLSAGMPAGGALAGQAAYAAVPGLPSGRPGRGDQKEENLRLFLLLDFLFSLMGRV